MWQRCSVGSRVRQRRARAIRSNRAIRLDDSWTVLTGITSVAVEDGFTAKAQGRPVGPPWDARDWVANDQWGWESAVTDEPDALYSLWYGAVARSRSACAALIANGGLDVTPRGDDDYIVNRRRVMVDLLEENLLHTGHASLLREAVDGLTGNGAP